MPQRGGAPAKREHCRSGRLGAPARHGAGSGGRALEPYCREFLYTHVDTEGLMGGTNREAILGIRRATTHRLTAAGGIATREEIDDLDRNGVDAVVGMALYTGRLEFIS